MAFAGLPVRAFAMIQYSPGPLVNATLTQSSGTQAELRDWLKDRLVQAGWDLLRTVVGSGYYLRSAATPLGTRAYVRIFSTGSVCLLVSPVGWADSNNDTGVPGNFFLLPASGKTWRFIGGPYQFFVTEDVSVGTARGVLAMGTPALVNPSSSQAPHRLAWGGCNATSENDTVAQLSWRKADVFNGNSWVDIGGSEYFRTASTGSRNPLLLGAPITWWPNSGESSLVSGELADGRVIIMEPLLFMGPVPWGKAPELCVGQLWDAVLVSGTKYPYGTVVSFDGHSWFAWTDWTFNGGLFQVTLFLAVS